MTPAVAVVIPAFNHSAHLAEAIDSVLAQDYPATTLLVIDDGSTDDTRQVLGRYGARVRWYSRENRGQSATLNEGWRQTPGDLLLYVGDDDLLLPGAIRTAISAWQAQPSCLGVYGNYRLIDHQSRTIRRVATPAIDLPRMLRDFETPPAAGTFVRRDVWERLGGWDESLRQVPDGDFFQRALLHGPLLQIDQELAAFRVHRHSQTFLPRDAVRAAEPARVVDRFFERADLPADILHLKQRARAMARIVAARHDLRRRDWRSAVRHLGNAVTIQPGIVAAPRAWRLLANGFGG